MWNRVTENLPPEGRDLLVWTGHYMCVSEAEIFSEEWIAANEAAVGQEWASSMRTSRGCFKEFGQSHYFDDPDVYWAELPESPK